MQLQLKAPCKKEMGFSLIELMVSTVIFLLFISAVYGLLQIGHVQRDTVTGQVEVIKNARFTLNTIGRDAVNAGLEYSSATVPDGLINQRLGVPVDADSTSDTVTAVISGNDITSTSDDILDGTDVVSFAFHDINANIGELINLTGAEDSSGSLSMYAQFTTTEPLVGDLYLISANNSNILGLVTAVAEVGGSDYPNLYKLTFGSGDCDSVGSGDDCDSVGGNVPFATSELNSLTCPTTSNLGESITTCLENNTSATARKINWVSYHVNNSGTLIRRTYGNNAGATAANQIQDQPIAYNIQNLQISYLMQNGTSSDDPSANETADNIVQLTVSTSVRVGINTAGGVNTAKTINLTSTFSTKNLHYINIS